jgi:phage tail P2-like protein
MSLTNSTLVDILAWQFHVDFYDPSFPLEKRKKLVQLSIQWHITKGTVALVQEVLDTYWPGGAYLQEWFQYRNPFPPNYPDPGWHDRYRFRVMIQQAVIDPADEAMVLQIIERYKPVSRWPEDIPFIRARPSEGTIYWAGVTFVSITRRSRAPTNYP